jgi:hypothetical protein
MMSVFSDPDQDLLEKSYKTVYVCSYRGDNALQVVPIHDIVSLVGMVPDFQFKDDFQAIHIPETRYFLVEKPSLEESHWFGIEQEDDPHSEDDDNDI